MSDEAYRVLFYFRSTFTTHTIEERETGIKTFPKSNLYILTLFEHSFPMTSQRPFALSDR